MSEARRDKPSAAELADAVEPGEPVESAGAPTFPKIKKRRKGPYASDDYRTALVRRGFVASMSRRGDCWDNAVAESFFATLKGEHVDHEIYATRDAATRSIADYIDNFYNVQRRHSSIGYISPMEYELRLQARREAA